MTVYIGIRFIRLNKMHVTGVCMPPPCDHDADRTFCGTRIPKDRNVSPESYVGAISTARGKLMLDVPGVKRADMCTRCALKLIDRSAQFHTLGVVLGADMPEPHRPEELLRMLRAVYRNGYTYWAYEREGIPTRCMRWGRMHVELRTNGVLSLTTKWFSLWVNSGRDYGRGVDNMIRLLTATLEKM